MNRLRRLIQRGICVKGLFYNLNNSEINLDVLNSMQSNLISCSLIPSDFSPSFLMLLDVNQTTRLRKSNFICRYLPPECFELSKIPLISSKVGEFRDFLSPCDHK